MRYLDAVTVEPAYKRFFGKLKKVSYKRFSPISVRIVFTLITNVFSVFSDSHASQMYVGRNLALFSGQTGYYSRSTAPTVGSLGLRSQRPQDINAHFVLVTQSSLRMTEID